MRIIKHKRTSLSTPRHSLRSWLALPLDLGDIRLSHPDDNRLIRPDKWLVARMTCSIPRSHPLNEFAAGLTMLPLVNPEQFIHLAAQWAVGHVESSPRGSKCDCLKNRRKELKGPEQFIHQQWATTCLVDAVDETPMLLQLNQEPDHPTQRASIRGHFNHLIQRSWKPGKKFQVEVTHFNIAADEGLQKEHGLVNEGRIISSETMEFMNLVELMSLAGRQGPEAEKLVQCNEK